jgi:hypothetical protein
VAALLRSLHGSRLDLADEVGTEARLPCGLLAVHVPETVAERRRVRREATRHGRGARPERLELCSWNVLVTNVPAPLLGLDEAWSLRRLRWQIELLFKVWKSEGRLDETRGERTWRVVCEAYAKLLGQVMQHWVSLVGAGSPLASSPRRAARVVRSAALRLARAVREVGRLVARLVGVGRILRRLCKVRRRRGRPGALQLVQDPALDTYAWGDLG